MEPNEFYRQIGQLSYTAARIDFLISNLAADLGLVRNYTLFYARTNFSWKIKDLKAHAGNSKISNQTKEDLIRCLDLLDDFRKIRNDFAHSIILENTEDTNELQLSNFIKDGNKVIYKVNSYKANELSQINRDFVMLHNKVYKIWMNIKLCTSGSC